MRRFARNEAGNLTIFALSLFVMMVMIGGVAVDLMRYESMRTSLQNTLDRATLASASLSQRLDPEEVVIDYFDKAGLAQFLSSVSVEEGLNYREVVADARAATNPFFLHMIGINEMDAPGHSMAEQRMTNVEIVLVLDVSGSMGSNSRLVNLKTAAKEFVDNVLSSDDEDRISIAIVPFNGQVNLGEALLQALQFPERSRRGQRELRRPAGFGLYLCRDFADPASDDGPCRHLFLDQLDLELCRSHQQLRHRQHRQPLVPAVHQEHRDDAVAKHRCPAAKIHNLEAIGATSINAGMKWGMALLDPGSQPVIGPFCRFRRRARGFDGRPFEFTDPEIDEDRHPDDRRRPFCRRAAE